VELDDRHTPHERRVAGGGAVLFALVAGLALADLAADLAEGTTLLHVLAEGGVVAVGVAGLVMMVRRLSALAARERELAAETERLTDRLQASRDEAERWRREAGDLLRGLGEQIDQQLDRWQLTPAEKEVALLLLKGLSLKELAAVRDVGEATARQQARAVYRKAGLSGRSELAAFFLEDLLLPPSGAPE
jgi:DNA-binding CsgD family transcriptional regulator